MGTEGVSTTTFSCGGSLVFGEFGVRHLPPRPNITTTETSNQKGTTQKCLFCRRQQVYIKTSLSKQYIGSWEGENTHNNAANKFISSKYLSQ